MKLDIQNLSLRNQAIAIFIGFVLLALVNYLVIASIQNENHEIVKRVELAKELQMLPDRLAITCQLMVDSDKRSKYDVQDQVERFEKVLYQLASVGHSELDTTDMPEHYGKIYEEWRALGPYLDVLIHHPLMKDTIVSEIREVPLNDSLNTITTVKTSRVLNVKNARVEVANSHIQDRISDISRLTRRVLSDKNKAFKKNNAAIDTVSLIFLLLYIAAVAGVIWWMKIKVSDPMDDLREVATHISNGDLTKRSDYVADNEIGKVALALNQVSANLQQATSFVNAIEQGKLDVNFDGLSKEDLKGRGLEGALLTMRDQMKKVQAEERQRNWSTEGLAKFVDILRTSSDNIYALGDIIISNLVEYTNSSQGGVYIVNADEEDNEVNLELVSLYAYDTPKYDKRSYRPGESLVGQTYQERKTIYLLEIPQEYIRITSGLGGANPKAILLVPLMVNDEIYGIIELASFSKYEPYQVEFVEKLGESIASTMAEVKNNQRTKLLLADSQEMTEQMRAQEEEMRQNMEELSATQEEMSRKEIEMSAQLTAINNSLATAEYSMDGTLLNANRNYVDVLGYARIEDIQDKSFRSLNAGDNEALWEDLKMGKSVTGKAVKITKDGDEITVNTTYTPVKNNIGDYFKVIELILGTTDSNVSTAPSADTDDWAEIREVEEALRQNLEELEITQEQLDEKLRITEATLDTLDNVVKIIIFNTEGSIIRVSYSAMEALQLEDVEISGQSISSITGQEVESIKNNEQIVLKVGTHESEIMARVHQDNTGERFYIIWI